MCIKITYAFFLHSCFKKKNEINLICLLFWIFIYFQIDLINDEEENDEDSSMFKWTKAKLIDLTNTLKIENKKLRQDNARLRTLRAINEGKCLVRCKYLL